MDWQLWQAHSWMLTTDRGGCFLYVYCSISFPGRANPLIVQYQTPEFDQDFGPYPYEKMGRPEEVSEGDATVSRLAPDNRIFNEPNKITAANFDG